MYQSPQQSGQWPPSSQPPQQQQQPSPPNWSNQPPNGQYTAPRPQQQIPPITQAVAPQGPQMATMQPPHPDQYRALPPPNHMYAPPYPHPQMPYPPPQPAPRQRTAIACRYCRRRKIRCSGYDQAEDGRCTNCQRFSQDCVFMPVSAQTQAFVPAHTVYRGHNPPPNAQLYGAYGQPLPQGGREPYPPQQQQGQYPPPPQGYQQPGMYQPPPQQVGTPGAGQKRSTDEPHTPTLPPPNPGAQAQLPRDGQFGGYPDPATLAQPGASPTSSTASFHSDQAPFYPQYHQPAPAPSYDAARFSTSPHAHGHPSFAAPPTSYGKSTGRTPPPVSVAHANAQRQGVSINELVGPQGVQQEQEQAQAGAGVRRDERTSTDTKQGETDGAAAAVANTTPMTDGHARPEANSTKKNGVDAGVQVNIIGNEHVPTSKEQDS